MDREEILSRSRAENKNKDLYGQEISKLAGSVTVTVMLIIAAVFFIVQMLAGGGLNFGLWALVFSGDAATHWVRYIKLRIKGELLAALLYTAIVLAMSGYHIYSLIS